MFYVIGLIIVGIVAGITSGLIGNGGGILVIPALVFFFGFTQHKAQGTTLALLVPPIGIFAAYTYYRAGNVDLKAAIIIAVGFLAGAWLGAHFASHIPEKALGRTFGAFVIVVGLKLLF